MRRLLLTTLLALGCGTEPPPNNETAPEACEPGRTDDFALGVVMFDNPRWFRAFDEGCETIEMQTGLQGGWHTEPALQAPRSAANNDLGGQIFWSVTDEDGNIVAEAQFELFRSFWQALEGGDAYWGDFVIFDRNPEGLIGTSLTIECMLDFDEDSRLGDQTITHVVTFVDEDSMTTFE